MFKNKVFSDITSHFSDLCIAATKQWTQDVSFTNADNWDAGRVPCAQDKVIFTDEVGWTKASLRVKTLTFFVMHVGLD